MTSWSAMEADKAFSAAARARRRASLVSRLRGSCSWLPVHEASVQRRRGPVGVREIPVDAIRATTEPNRAAQFDREFRPAGLTRSRWQRIWLAAYQGATLPPISVVQVGDGYAIRDGHHRVSVARARGAVTISALVAAG